MWTDLLTFLCSAILKNISVPIHHDGEVLYWAYHGRKWVEFNVYLSSFQKSLRNSLEAPEIMMTDFAKFDRPGQLHIAYQALHEFVKQKGCLPKPRKQVRTCIPPPRTVTHCLSRTDICPNTKRVVPKMGCKPNWSDITQALMLMLQISHA